jgi:hypothetical protein
MLPYVAVLSDSPDDWFDFWIHDILYDWPVFSIRQNPGSLTEFHQFYLNSQEEVRLESTFSPLSVPFAGATGGLAADPELTLLTTDENICCLHIKKSSPIHTRRDVYDWADASLF